MVPQIILISMWSLNLLLTSYQHGKPKTGTHNIFTTIIATIIEGSILYFGGFFNVFWR